MSLRTFTIENEIDDQSLELRCDITDNAKIASALSKNDIRILSQLANSSNSALLGEIEIDDNNYISVVVKPAMYENPLFDFEWGTLSKREVCAFELSKALGWDIVPETVLRDVDNMESSVQLFIPHDPREHYFTFSKANKDIMEMFAVFDYLINNADRKAGHILREVTESFKFSVNEKNDQKQLPGKHFFGIDHGLCFNVEDKLRTVIWEFSEQAISEHLIQDISKNFNKIETAIDPYLSKHEIEKTILRVEQLLMNPFHRALDANPRAFPWPLV